MVKSGRLFQNICSNLVHPLPYTVAKLEKGCFDCPTLKFQLTAVVLPNNMLLLQPSIWTLSVQKGSSDIYAVGEVTSYSCCQALLCVCVWCVDAKSPQKRMAFCTGKGHREVANSEALGNTKNVRSQWSQRRERRIRAERQRGR